MIVSFSLENWMSFRDRSIFSMVATRERQHGERVPNLRKYHMRILPIAAFYGGNASGKTNFFKALDFARNLVVESRQPDSQLPVEPFLLSADGTERPSRFAFVLLIDDTMYEFSFAVTREKVLEEKLVLIKSASEKVLYDRRDGEPHFDASLSRKQFLRFAFQGTRDNQLFLSNSVSQGIDTFSQIHDWFNKSLMLIRPTDIFLPIERYLDEKSLLRVTANEFFSLADTGITRLGAEATPFENIPLSESDRARVQEGVREGMIVRLSGSASDRMVVVRDKDELLVKKLVAYHSRDTGEEVKFDMGQESDGSQRMIQLFPAFHDLSRRESTTVCVIDEIDRSLHTLLLRYLLELYLAGCSRDTRSQMLLTTHDALLMDQDLLRRDEMWASERDSSGNSTLFSLSDYKDIRYDKDIRKSYLQGRLGGIPRISPAGSFADLCFAEESAEDS